MTQPTAALLKPANASGLSLRLNPLVELHWRQFGNDWVLFEATSGLTHQMDALTSAVLMCFDGEGDVLMDSIQPLLAADIDDAQTVPNAAQIQTAIEQLRGLGLILTA